MLKATACDTMPHCGMILASVRNSFIARDLNAIASNYTVRDRTVQQFEALRLFALGVGRAGLQRGFNAPGNGSHQLDSCGHAQLMGEHFQMLVQREPQYCSHLALGQPDSIRSESDSERHGTPHGGQTLWHIGAGHRSLEVESTIRPTPNKRHDRKLTHSPSCGTV